jgi:hypothetical protein
MSLFHNRNYGLRLREYGEAPISYSGAADRSWTKIQILKIYHEQNLFYGLQGIITDRSMWKSKSFTGQIFLKIRFSPGEVIYDP